MNKHEDFQIPKEAKLIDDCAKAIRIFWDCYNEYSGNKSSKDIDKMTSAYVLNDVDSLADGIDMRYGAPGWGGR